MKKLIMIITLILFIGVNFAQSQDRTVDLTLGAEQSIYDYTGVDADTMGTAVDTLSYTMKVNKNNPVLHNIQVQTAPVDAIDGTVTLDVKVYGRVFTTDSWSEVDVTNTGNDATGTVNVNVYSEETAAIDTLAANTSPFYRQFKVEITFNDTTGLDAGEQVGVDFMYWKFYNR